MGWELLGGGGGGRRRKGMSCSSLEDGWTSKKAAPEVKLWQNAHTHTQSSPRIQTLGQFDIHPKGQGGLGGGRMLLIKVKFLGGVLIKLEAPGKFDIYRDI